MHTLDTIDRLEHYTVNVERAQAVLSEALDYFEIKDNDHRALLPGYASHILLLLHVVDDLLSQAQK